MPITSSVDLIVTKQELTDKDEPCFVCSDCQNLYNRTIKCNLSCGKAAEPVSTLKPRITYFEYYLKEKSV